MWDCGGSAPWNIMSFRKIDVDAFDEDALHDDELYDPDPRSPDQVLNDARQRQAVVRSTLSKWVASHAFEKTILIVAMNAEAT